jgi:hypothetical protein
MNNRTTTILQRAPVVLAVTAASYGLPPPGPGRQSRSRKPPEGGFSRAAKFSYTSPVRRISA